MSSISDSQSPDHSGPYPGPPRVVLAATDLSEPSDAALVSAATMGAGVGAEVHLVHCVKRPGPFGWWDEEGASARLAEAEATLRDQVIRACGQGWKPSSAVVTSGRPATEIDGRASAVGADLIVLGPGRRRFRGATRLGSTADRVIRTSRGPCLLAHAPLQAAPRVVVLATDFSPSARRARDVIVAWLIAGLGRADPGGDPPTLVVLCVSAFADRPQPPRSPASLLEAEVARIEERIGPGRIAVEPAIYSAPLVVDGIQRVAEQRAADLVVVGTHGYNPFSRMLVGSVATALAGSLDRPILVVPPEPQPEDDESA
jgi:universal stress protein E